VEHIEERGFPMQSTMATKIFTSYLARCERAGLNRIDRTSLPLEALGIDVNQFKGKGDRTTKKEAVDANQ